MGDLERDTAVERTGEGRYRAVVSTDWALLGPVGGYLAGIALRAAGAHSGLPRPASLSCQYLSRARFDAVDLRVECQRRSRSAAALTVLMTQRGTPVLSAQVWAIADDIAGPEQRLSHPPDVPAPEQLAEIVLDPQVAQRTTAAATATGTFWRNLELRCVDDRSRPEEPRVHSWVRFRPRARFADPWVDACRDVISIDTGILPAVAMALGGGGRFVAPSMDLYVAFHSPAAADDYLLVTARGTAAGAGLLSGTAQTRSPDGTLLASGAAQFLCRMLRA
ncbi:acyl-CoA thioesterase [Plantactinospora siamensis]|uniref:Acyl-CoA thioesterase n=1 Tax=Plantactinospora siamensis TaxID=555372 RepID=A0ABV6P4D0_9ACTN